MACAAMLLAACQSDELIDQSAIVNNANRPTIDLSLTAPDLTLEDGDAATKMGAEIVNGKMRYSWVSTDRLGAAVMDGVSEGTYETSNKVIFNYPFDFTVGAEEGASFSAKSPIMSGTYFFYHQYKQNTAREVLKLALEDQQAYVGGEGAETAENQMAQYIIGISPAIKLSKGIAMDDEGASSLALPIQFKKINAAIQFNITPKDLPEGTEITKIVLERNGMVLGGTVDFNTSSPLGENTAAIDVMSYDQTGKEGNANGVLDADELANVSEAIAEATEDIDLNNLFASIGKSTTNAITLSMYANSTAKANGERGIALNNGTTLKAYMVVPAVETQGTDAYTVKIYTTEGYVEKEVENLQIVSGNVYASKFKFDLNKSELQDIEAFDIASSVDWKEAVQFVKDHVDNYVGADKILFNITSNQNDPIYVSELPAYGITMQSGNSAAYYICLGNEDGTAATFDMSKTSLKVKDNNLNLMVGKGATVTLNTLPAKNAGSETFAVINNGSLNVAEAVPSTVVSQFINNADMTVSVAQIADMKVENKGNLRFVGSTTATATQYNVALTNRKNVTIDNKANVVTTNTLVNDDNVAATTTATITVNGILSGDAVKDLTENYIIGSTGDLQLATSATTTAVIDNSGKLTVATGGATNEGTINVKANSKSSNQTITNKGTIVIEDIDNYIANQGDLNKAGEKYLIDNFSNAGTTTAIVTKKSQISSATSQNINNITISGAWTVGAGSGDTTVEASTFQGVGVTLNGATLTVATTIDASGNNMIVKGNSSIAVATAQTVKYQTLTVAEGAAMTIGKNVTVEIVETSGIGVTVLGSLTNSGTLTASTDNAWKMTVGATTINGARHAATLTNTADGNIGTTSSRLVTITNYGTVNFMNGNAYGSISNQGAASFQGNMKQ